MAAVDRLDLLLIGTNDPCAECGIAGQYDHPLVAEACARTLAACRRHGRHVGIGGWPRSRICSRHGSRRARATVSSDLTFSDGGGRRRRRVRHRPRSER